MRARWYWLLAAAAALAAALVWVWRAPLVEALLRQGLAASGGELVALDAASGAVKWRQKFEAAVHGAPTVAGGKVYLSSANSVAYAVDTDTGRIAGERIAAADWSAERPLPEPCGINAALIYDDGDACA